VARIQPTPELTSGERAWAIFQHRTAAAVLNRLEDLGKNLDWLAVKLGVNGDWLTRKLYGRVPADLAEMFEWCESVGIKLEVNIDG
jgi:hypothetical protein